MARRTTLTVAGWLAAAVAATLVGLAAVRLIGAGITGTAPGDVLTPEQVAAALASPAPSPARPTPTPSAGGPAPSAPAIPSRTALSTPGGTVVAACADGLVTLLSWAPAQGFAVADVEHGPDRRAEVRFQGAGGRVEVKVVCDAGRPVASWKRDG